MPRPPIKPHDSLSLEVARDSQQWMVDYLLKTTGRDHNYAFDGRKFPAEVKSYRMIPRVMYRVGRHQETLAKAAEEHGHNETALELYINAAQSYRQGEHALPHDDHPDKIFLYQRMKECYDRIIALSPYPIERIEVPWEGVSIQGLLHLVPGGRRLPTVLWCPGMDMTKERSVDPTSNPFLRRAMNVFVMDGPGQGMSNLRKIRVTADNYERAGKACIEYLSTRSEVDPDRIAVMGSSMGSYWAMRVAVTVPQVKAVAVVAACWGGMRAIFQEASPTFKQVFMYMAGIRNEQEFDRMAEKMTMLDRADEIRCPSLQVIGEYDPLCHLEDGYAVYEKLAGPKEFWVLEDDFHGRDAFRGFGGLRPDSFMVDWLRDALAGRFPQGHARQVLIRRSSGAGPYDPPSAGFWLPERAL